MKESQEEGALDVVSSSEEVDTITQGKEKCISDSKRALPYVPGTNRILNNNLNYRATKVFGLLSVFPAAVFALEDGSRCEAESMLLVIWRLGAR